MTKNDPDDPGQIEASRHGRVLVLQLTRKGNGNRMTQQMGEQAVIHLEAARTNRDISGCVLTGHGEDFCLGGDYRSAGASSAGRLEFGRAFADVVQAMRRLGKPIVAAVNGNAHAGGFALLAACDMAVAADSATFGLPEAAHGLFPFLALAIVKDSLPTKVLWDMVYRARMLDAGEAKSLYLVNDVVPKAGSAAARRRAGRLYLGAESGHRQSRPRSVLQHALRESGRSDRAIALRAGGGLEGHGRGKELSNGPIQPDRDATGT